MEKKNEIKDLRDLLFNQLNKLSDPNCDLDKEIKRSEAMVTVGNVIVNSAKTEVDFMRVAKSRGTGFMGLPDTVEGPKEIGNGEQ